MLFKDSNKLKEYTEFTEVNFASVALTIRQVEDAYLVDVLGDELYNSLNIAYNLASTEGSLNIAQQKLLDKCRMLIGPYVAYNYAPKSDVQLSDAGARRAETAQLKTAYAYQLQNLREQKLREAEQAAEALLRFLDLNKVDYPEWVSSIAFEAYTSLFIRNGRDFNALVTTASPYRNYWAWRYKMEEVEQQNIREALGDAMFNDLKAKAKAGTLTDTEKTLLFPLRKAIAYFTISFAVPFHAVRMDSGGITVVNIRGGVQETDNRAPAADNQLSNVIRNSADAGGVWLQNAINFILTNPTDFPLYPFFPTLNNTVACTLTNSDLTGCFGMT